MSFDTDVTPTDAPAIEPAPVVEPGPEPAM